MNDIEIKIEFKKKLLEKLLEFLVESNKPKKYEVGYVEAKTIVSDGLSILGLDANDILGFAKAPNEVRIRRVRGSQAWFKKMYENGWKYAGNFEYAGLLNNGYVVMERELPNPVLDAIREELEAIFREDEGSKYIHVPNPLMDRGEPKVYGPGPDGGYMNRDVIVVPESPEDLQPYPIKLRKNVDLEETIKKAIKKAREPKEGFESEVNDFMINAKTEMKSDEQLFFEETGKNAVWHGKSTKAFKEWKERLE